MNGLLSVQSTQCDILIIMIKISHSVNIQSTEISIVWAELQSRPLLSPRNDFVAHVCFFGSTQILWSLQPLPHKMCQLANRMEEMNNFFLSSAFIFLCKLSKLAWKEIGFLMVFSWYFALIQSFTNCPPLDLVLVPFLPWNSLNLMLHSSHDALPPLICLSALNTHTHFQRHVSKITCPINFFMNTHKFSSPKTRHNYSLAAWESDFRIL